ncbi:prolyl oligopeptidase family serine peptidase [Sinorhizobium meliloti]|uniref:carboxylesterase family protein n=1 Tax=Rhizobium meliloti TaxID=382 RepID=UPI000FD6038B|nr:prolyl oligopeptidase family serine peptidase [Sinorhizobium meliloti]MDW9446221.1 prolyl oligopeptidase family serine peptidase [Sinorhizobium meliloti]MDW9523921.1 prolyl oligopeptidase family serine peptidase [Sinorhizobium meliloti]MDW9568896.1 prolyl oligopeptidase family serine peptidase [Sinorhizobium meliloti]MDW9591932.1 prolyl oligopeptidase family serine peptidase [Sinorhizobium meliloti]MDW9659660.1 prolyl oligopeptidase family serine peptidase [Sinorhizobium meliloti]
MLRRILPLAAIAALGLFDPEAAIAEQVALTSTVSVKNELKYLLYTPDGYATSTETYPLVIWLHGGDQGGSDIDKVKSSGIPKLIEDGKKFPFLVFSPQNPSEELLYPIEKVDAALEEVASTYRVDRSRIYVIGFSRGGFGAWALAEQFPDKFAAIVPIAGGGNRHYLNRTNEKAAFWVFHGSDDGVIPLSDSVVLYERLKALDRNARLTVLEGVDHSGVEWATLNDAELWDWLLKQRLEGAPQ